MRSIPDPGFSGDDGAADAALADALTAYAERPDSLDGYHGVLEALQDARVLVPVVAVADEVEHGASGLSQEKRTDMATVLVTAGDGSRAMLAFTATATLAAWQAGARPVPVTARTAALAALDDDAEALVVDLAGPALFAVEEDDLRSLAAGERLVRVGDAWAWVRPTG